MTKKVFITDKNMATFVCPECKALKTANVEKYAQLKQTDRVVNTPKIFMMYNETRVYVGIYQ